MYPDDNRDFDLALLGGEFYGGLGLGKGRGSLKYHTYIGEERLDANGGYLQLFAGLGLTFPQPPSGRTFGGDMRWATPVRGLTVGSSALSQSLDGTGPQGTIHLPAEMLLAQYAEWTKGRLHIAGEYWRTPAHPVLTIGSTSFPLGLDSRAWYPMVSYQVTKKLQVGSYYSHYVDKSYDTSQPANYSKDRVVSGRYDFNQYFYGKVEGHFLHGEALGYYADANPKGLKPNSNMLAARIGFAF
jgi:hypothetical protein